MPTITIISGGQTGADQAALHAAKAAGFPTGGWAPKGWLTEAGPAPWLADFGLKEHASADYPPRTRDNVLAADHTLLLVCGITGYGSRGTQLALRLAREAGKPHTVVDVCRLPDAAPVAAALAGVRTLNVAGNRESGAPGIGAKAEKFLAELFRLLGEAQ